MSLRHSLIALGAAAVVVAPLGAQMAGHAGHGAAAPQAQGAPAEHGTPTARASAAIKGQGVSGTAELVEYKMGTAVWVQLTLKVTGLTAGMHGVHLHAVGKCEPDFTAAGGHFDPGPAGNTDPDMNHPFHMGDLPNLDVKANGQGELVAATTRVTLSAGPLSIFDTDGTAIILHGNPDQGITGEAKSGVSGGPRVGCGVFQKQ